jgi:hypothetical protein
LALKNKESGYLSANQTPIRHPEPIIFLVCEDLSPVHRDQVDAGYDGSIGYDIQQAGQVIIEIPEKVQTGQAGGNNGDQHHDRN